MTENAIDRIFKSEGRCVKNWFELGAVLIVAVSKESRESWDEDKLLHWVNVGVGFVHAAEVWVRGVRDDWGS
jgi:hypothetical protein